MAFKSPLYDILAASGAGMGDYRGVGTALGWKDAAAEFAILRSDCAIYDLGWRAKLLITGKDRTRWMNSMVTNNIRDLAVNSGAYNFLLTPQGKIQADLYVYNRGDYLLVDTDLSQVSKVAEILRKYIIMDKVEIADGSAKLTAIGVTGKHSPAVLQYLKLAADVGALQVVDAIVENVDVSLVRMEPDATYEIWVSPAHAREVWNALLRAGGHAVGARAVELARVADGIPIYGQDIRDRELPQETEQSRALNFQKGCYIGQEIVERIRARGQVHRKFTGFRFAGAVPDPGSKIESDGKEAGEVTSVAVLPLNGQDCAVGLGYIRREIADAGSAVRVNGTEATVVALPFESL